MTGRPSYDREEALQLWKRSGGRSVQVSAWIGVLLGAAIMSVIYSLPIYLLIAAFTSLNLVPSERTDLMVWGTIAAVGFVGAVSNNKPDGATRGSSESP